MPTFEIDYNGGTYEVDAPSEQIAILSLKSSLPTQDEKDYQASQHTGNFGEGVMDAVKGAGSLFTTNPFTTAKNMVNAQVGEGKKAFAAGGKFGKTGDWKDASEAVGHGLATVLPGIGPVAANAGEDLGTDDPRSVGRGVTNSLFALAPMGAKAGARNIKPAVGALARNIPVGAIRHPIAYAVKAAVKGASKWGAEGAEGEAEAGAGGAKPRTPSSPPSNGNGAPGEAVKPKTRQTPREAPRSDAHAEAYADPGVQDLQEEGYQAHLRALPNADSIPGVRRAPSPAGPSPVQQAGADSFSPHSPLPSTGVMRSEPDAPVQPRPFSSKSKAARGSSLSPTDRALYSKLVGEGMSDEEAMAQVGLSSGMRAPFRKMSGVADAVRKDREVVSSHGAEGEWNGKNYMDDNPYSGDAQSAAKKAKGKAMKAHAAKKRDLKVGV